MSKQFKKAEQLMSHILEYLNLNLRLEPCLVYVKKNNILESAKIALYLREVLANKRQHFFKTPLEKSTKCNVHLGLNHRSCDIVEPSLIAE